MTNDPESHIQVAKGIPLYPLPVAEMMRLMGEKPPAQLEMRGNTDLLTKAAIGFCGSRHVSQTGLDIARDCSEQLARQNICVISGNAAGVDFQAHFTSLEAGGTTILVLVEGMDHFRIKKDLKPVWDWERALVISPFKKDQIWKSWRAMSRNALLIALRKALIVIEAGEKGGTIDAGKKTLKAGHPLFVAWHRDMKQQAQGNQILLSQTETRKLVKSRQSGRANLREVLQATATTLTTSKQMSLLLP